MEEEKVRISLRSFDYSLIDKTCMDIIEAAKKTGATISGPVPLPTKIERFCVLRSPHVNKKSREIFELRSHKRLIDVFTSKRTIEYFLDLAVPSGVHVQIKLKGK